MTQPIPLELQRLLDFALARQNPLVIVSFAGLVSEWYTRQDTVLLLPQHNEHIKHKKYQYPDKESNQGEEPREAAAKRIKFFDSSRESNRCIPISVDTVLGGFTHVYYRFDSNDQLEGVFAYAIGTDHGPVRIGDNLSLIFNLDDIFANDHPEDAPVRLTPAHAAPSFEELIPAARRRIVMEGDVQDADDYASWLKKMAGISQDEFPATGISVVYDGIHLNTHFELDGQPYAFSSPAGERGFDHEIMNSINRLVISTGKDGQFVMLWGDDFGEESVLAYVTANEYQALKSNVRYKILGPQSIFERPDSRKS